jgi:hypothetical protein
MAWSAPHTHRTQRSMITLLTVIFIGQLYERQSYHLSTVMAWAHHTRTACRSMIRAAHIDLYQTACTERQSYHQDTVMYKAHHTRHWVNDPRCSLIYPGETVRATKLSSEHGNVPGHTTHAPHAQRSMITLLGDLYQTCTSIKLSSEHSNVAGTPHTPHTRSMIAAHGSLYRTAVRATKLSSEPGNVQGTPHRTQGQ